MLFKKLHKKLEAPGKDTENDASELNELNEEDETLLEERYQKLLKKRNRTDKTSTYSDYQYRADWWLSLDCRQRSGNHNFKGNQ